MESKLSYSQFYLPFQLLIDWSTQNSNRILFAKFQNFIFSFNDRNLVTEVLISVSLMADFNCQTLLLRFFVDIVLELAPAVH